MSLKNLRKLVLADLEQGQRLIKQFHPDPIDPQFRIATPAGDWWMAITLGDDEAERARRLALVSDLMASKLSVGFVMVAELYTPDCIFALGVTHRETIGCVSVMSRAPLSFAEVRWMAKDEIGDDVPDLLPRGKRALSDDRMRKLDEWFGPVGNFPAVKIAGGVARNE
jgi:hypothetical protein